MSHNWTVSIPGAPEGQLCFVLLGFCHLIRLIPGLMCSTLSSWIKLMAKANHWKSKYKRRSNFTGNHLGLGGSFFHASFFCLPSSFIYPVIQSTLMFLVENQGTINVSSWSYFSITHSQTHNEWLLLNYSQFCPSALSFLFFFLQVLLFSSLS